MNIEEAAVNGELLGEIVKDGFMEINGTEYKYTKFTHKDRLQVLAYSQRLKDKTSNVGDSAWQNFEELVNRKITVDDSLISKLPDYWEDHAEDYLTVMMYSLNVVIYPFVRGKTTS